MYVLDLVVLCVLWRHCASIAGGCEAECVVWVIGIGGGEGGVKGGGEGGLLCSCICMEFLRVASCCVGWCGVPCCVYCVVLNGTWLFEGR